MTIGEWAYLISRGYPEDWITAEDYQRDLDGLPDRRKEVWFRPPIAPDGSKDTMPGTAARAELYEWRIANGYHLWHHNDITVTEIDHVATSIKTLPNGRIESLGLCWTGPDEEYYD